MRPHCSFWKLFEATHSSHHQQEAGAGLHIQHLEQHWGEQWEPAPSGVSLQTPHQHKYTLKFSFWVPRSHSWKPSLSRTVNKDTLGLTWVWSGKRPLGESTSSTWVSRWHPPAQGKGLLHVLHPQSALQPSSQASQPPSTRNNYQQNRLQWPKGTAKQGPCSRSCSWRRVRAQLSRTGTDWV